jgi:ribokinase
MATILVDAAAENVIVVDSGANAHLAPAHVDAGASLIGAAAVVVAQLETPPAATARAFEIARAAGAATLLNAAPAPEAIDVALLALTDILVVNEGEGRAISGVPETIRIGEALLRLGPSTVVVTLGGHGAVLFERGRPPITATPPPVTVLDTTGAGDAFAGAFAARWAVTRDVGAALAWGVAAGSLACTRKGAAASCADAAEIAAAVEIAFAL